MSWPSLQYRGTVRHGGDPIGGRGGPSKISIRPLMRPVQTCRPNWSTRINYQKFGGISPDWTLVEACRPRFSSGGAVSEEPRRGNRKTGDCIWLLKSWSTSWLTRGWQRHSSRAHQIQQSGGGGCNEFDKDLASSLLANQLRCTAWSSSQVGGGPGRSLDFGKNRREAQSGE